MLWFPHAIQIICKSLLLASIITINSLNSIKAFNQLFKIWTQHLSASFLFNFRQNSLGPCQPAMQLIFHKRIALNC